MDPRRFLTLAVLSIGLTTTLGACALLPRPPGAPVPALGPIPSAPAADAAPAETPVEPVAAPATRAPPVADVAATSAAPRPYLAVIATEGAASRPPEQVEGARAAQGPAAIAAANRSARTESSIDGFVGGVQVFDWREGGVYAVRTAPLRVTALTLAPGETVTAKAAGDTVRWQIGESVSGSGAAARTHVLIKPLRTGLETNLILTTSQRVYLIALTSGPARSANTAVAWDYGVLASSPFDDPEAASASPPVDVEAVAPEGPLDARYRVEVGRRPPSWTPTAVFSDGTRTFIALSLDVEVGEAPALFIRSEGGLELVNYRQSDNLLIVDRRFDEAELRLGDRRPQVVRIHRQRGAVR